MTSPAVGSTSPAIIFNWVDLPETVDADQTDAIAGFDFPIDVFENFSRGVNFADVF